MIKLTVEERIVRLERTIRQLKHDISELQQVAEDIRSETSQVSYWPEKRLHYYSTYSVPAAVAKKDGKV